MVRCVVVGTVAASSSVLRCSLVSILAPPFIHPFFASLNSKMHCYRVVAGLFCLACCRIYIVPPPTHTPLLTHTARLVRFVCDAFFLAGVDIEKYHSQSQSLAPSTKRKDCSPEKPATTRNED